MTFSKRYRKIGIPKKKLIALYALISRIRESEIWIESEYHKDEMKTPVHLCIGQEAIAAAVSANLKEGDHVFSNHRGHGHYISKGGDLNALIAELYCKETGCSRGRGGSMHLADTKVGLLGSSSIVGGAIPIAVGAAMAISMGKTRQVSVAFFGDAATEEGVFYESINFAVLRRLPVILVCENNFYSVCSHQSKRQPTDNIYNKLERCGIPGFRVDGTNVIEAYLTARRCIMDARSGKGPSLIECRAYRWRGHAGSGPDTKLGYRPERELNRWVRKCPVTNFKKFLLEKDIATAKEINAIDKAIKEDVGRAFIFAKESPLPKKEEIGRYLYH